MWAKKRKHCAFFGLKWFFDEYARMNKNIQSNNNTHTLDGSTHKLSAQNLNSHAIEHIYLIFLLMPFSMMDCIILKKTALLYPLTFTIRIFIRQNRVVAYMSLFNLYTLLYVWKSCAFTKIFEDFSWCFVDLYGLLIIQLFIVLLNIQHIKVFYIQFHCVFKHLVLVWL